MSILYLDCIAGISGDMTLGALVDAGADPRYIETELAKLALPPYSLRWSRVNKRGISAMKADVLPDPDVRPAAHAHYGDIVKRIREAGLPERATARSLAVFEAIGKAEGKIHGIPLEKVHFHEVGAVDSIVDTVGVALALESLGIDTIVCSPVPLGCGTVVCAHGVYPVPAPATLELMKGIPLASLPIAKELTTPTGAGIVRALADEFSAALPPLIVQSVGYGAGTRDLEERPNVLRAVVGNLGHDHHRHPHEHHEHHEHHDHDHDHHHDH
ncbi:nickel pincer cofactor biosynthesis protein LarC [Cohnella fermenti]|uniref:LarC family nickel insertion protein n=1 Tax=Cohnella fermenti TaxID=2565925 RepID=A0A4V3WEK6_9BACL|nr:LarC family nickel insertion protein [Cohnella fermenti]THF76695.1 LarC family nickel insertion protein [Cohnella fermenti]